MQSHGLTTTKSFFIEKARQAGELFIEQPYSLYSEDNQKAWQELYQLLLPKWEKYAHQRFLEGISKLVLQPNKIPCLHEVNLFLEPLTGFKAKAVSGYVPTFKFFDSLKKREFPTTITIRDSQCLQYLPEPDIFHDIAGHVPMHTEKTFADVLVKLGSLAEIAAKRSQDITIIASNIRALSRFFWFTIEFGLIRQNNSMAVYGSGLLSSAAEITHAIESHQVQRHLFQMEWVINQSFEIDHFQSLLFMIESFEHLFEEVERLEKWLLAGKLDHVALGKPETNDLDFAEFIK